MCDLAHFSAHWFQEAMCALLVLFLTDTNRVQHNRLQKIIKSLCTHAPTCDFIIRAMLTMLDKVCVLHAQLV
jgi:coenzyme F420-reducing hydrogenase delta subunit